MKKLLGILLLLTGITYGCGFTGGDVEEDPVKVNWRKIRQDIAWTAAYVCFGWMSRNEKVFTPREFNAGNRARKLRMQKNR